LTIPGLASPVFVESSPFSGRYTITAGGYPAARLGRLRYAVPAAGGGTVETSISGGFFDAYPTLTVNGIKHRTGPPVPVILRILAVAPIALVIGGLIGGLIGALGCAVNMAVVRMSLPSVGKAVLVLAVGFVAFVMYVVAAAAVAGAFNS
jgi:hypothetical protein